MQEGARRAPGPAAAAGSAAGRRGRGAALARGSLAGLGRAAPRAQQREADAEPAARPPQPSPRHLWPRLQEKRGRGGSGQMPLALRPSPGCAEPRNPAPHTVLSLRCAGTVTASQIQKKLFTPVPSLPGVSRRNLREGAGRRPKQVRPRGRAPRSGWPQRGPTSSESWRGMEMCNIPGASLASDFPSASL